MSVDTYKPAVAEAAIAAGAVLVNDVSGLRDPALADLCARTGAGLVVMHTRVAPKGTLLDPGHYDDVVGRRDAASCTSGWRSRSRAASTPSSCCSTPGPTSPRRRPRPSPCCGGSTTCSPSAGRVLLAISNKDFVGALTGRPPRERLAGTLAAVAHGLEAGAHVLRVHDVAAAADFLRVRAALRGEVELAPERWARPPTATLTERKGLPAAAHNAAGCQPTTHLKGYTPCPQSWTAPSWSRARSPTFTCWPTSSASTASAASARPS